MGLLGAVIAGAMGNADLAGQLLVKDQRKKKKAEEEKRRNIDEVSDEELREKMR